MEGYERMLGPQEVIQVELTPIAPDTISSVKEELNSYIETALQSAGHVGLLSQGEIRLEVERTFPTDAVIIIYATLASKIAYDVWKEFVVPALKQRFGVREKIRTKMDDSQEQNQNNP